MNEEARRLQKLLEAKGIAKRSDVFQVNVPIIPGKYDENRLLGDLKKQEPVEYDSFFLETREHRGVTVGFAQFILPDGRKPLYEATGVKFTHSENKTTLSIQKDSSFNNIRRVITGSVEIESTDIGDLASKFDITKPIVRQMYDVRTVPPLGDGKIEVNHITFQKEEIIGGGSTDLTGIYPVVTFKSNSANIALRGANMTGFRPSGNNRPIDKYIQNSIRQIKRKEK